MVHTILFTLIYSVSALWGGVEQAYNSTLPTLNMETEIAALATEEPKVPHVNVMCRVDHKIVVEQLAEVLSEVKGKEVGQCIIDNTSHFVRVVVDTCALFPGNEVSKKLGNAFAESYFLLYRLGTCPEITRKEAAS